MLFQPAIHHMFFFSVLVTPAQWRYAVSYYDEMNLPGLNQADARGGSAF